MDLKNKIAGLIVHKMPDSFTSHLKSLWLRFEWCGYIKDGEFKVWKNGSWNGLLYPVIDGKIEGNKVNLRYYQNPLGRVLFFIWSVVLPCLIVAKPIEILIEGKGTLLLVILVIIIPLCFYLLIRFINKKIMKITIDEFSEFLKTENHQWIENIARR